MKIRQFCSGIFEQVGFKSKLIVCITIALVLFAVFSSATFSLVMNHFGNTLAFSELHQILRVAENRLELSVEGFRGHVLLGLRQEDFLRELYDWAMLGLQSKTSQKEAALSHFLSLTEHSGIESVAIVLDDHIQIFLSRGLFGIQTENGFWGQHFDSTSPALQDVIRYERILPPDRLVHAIQQSTPGFSLVWGESELALVYRKSLIFSVESEMKTSKHAEITFVQYLNAAWLRSMIFDHGIGMLLADSKGNKTFRTSKAFATVDLNAIALAAQDAFRNDRGVVEGHASGTYHVFSMIPLGADHDAVMLGVTIPDVFFQKLIWRSIGIVFALSMVILIVLVLIVRGLLQRMIAPITELADAATRLAGGDFESPINCTGHDEVGLLAQSFETMRHNLKSSFDEISIAQCRLSRFIEKTLEGVFRLDEQGLLVEANPAMAHMFGYDDISQFLRSPYRLFLQSFTHEQHADAFLSCLREGHAVTGFEVLLQTRNGPTLWGRISALPVKDDTNQFCGVEGHIENVTDRIAAYKALHQAKKDLEVRVAERTSQLAALVKILEHRNELVARLNTMSAQLQACANMADLCSVLQDGLAALFPENSGALYLRVEGGEQLVNIHEFGDTPSEEPLIDVKSCRALTQHDAIGLRFEKKHLCENFSRPEEIVFCIPLRGYNMTHGVFQVRSLKTALRDEHEHRSTHELAVDVADHIALAIANILLREKLLQQNVRDPLTNLYNRRYLKEVIDREGQRAKRHQRTIGVIFMDIDKFKLFNDTYGHDAGDYILKQVGGFINDNIREEDTAFRYGGEEFLILLPEIDLEDIILRAESLRRQIKNLSFQYKDTNLGPITVSVGVAVFPQHGHDLDNVVLYADDLLLKAKSSGRDRVVYPEIENE
ncbi:diguanylate cyclase [Desulfovibrio inopinatus]|uniref:diguanylate cyclase n=1 Tax=Desulfovibrio inopinatus TaxID=102109 RepID=UPI000489FDA0|nr:diguanylate cyclase [Desulfovibrio inopinatus]